MKPEEVELIRRDYTANNGWETFLSYEDPRQDILIGLLRLRKISGADSTRQVELRGRWVSNLNPAGCIVVVLGWIE